MQKAFSEINVKFFRL